MHSCDEMAGEQRVRVVSKASEPRILCFLFSTTFDTKSSMDCAGSSKAIFWRCWNTNYSIAATFVHEFDLVGTTCGPGLSFQCSAMRDDNTKNF